LPGFAGVSDTTTEDDTACDVDETPTTVADKTSLQKLFALQLEQDQILKYKLDTTHPIL